MDASFKWRSTWLMIPILAASVLLGGPGNTAELIPFPSDTMQQQQQVPVHPRAQFRTEIRDMPSCADLSNLRTQLIRRLRSARTERDARYYSGFVADINQEMAARKCETNP